MQENIVNIIKELETAAGLTIDEKSLAAVVKQVTPIITEIKRTAQGYDNEYSRELEGTLLKTATQWLVTIKKIMAQQTRLAQSSDNKTAGRERKILDKLFLQAENEIVAMRENASEVATFYRRIRRAQDNYDNCSTFINQDFGGLGVKGLRVRAHQLKREKAPANCYHFHIEHEKISGDPFEKYDDELLRLTFGENPLENLSGQREYNYEIVLKDGQWHVYTGEYYYPDPNTFSIHRKIKVLQKDSAVLLGAFPYDKFFLAKQCCLEHCDPLGGQLKWTQKTKQLTGQLDRRTRYVDDQMNPVPQLGADYTRPWVGADFLGLVEYEIINHEDLPLELLHKHKKKIPGFQLIRQIGNSYGPKRGVYKEFPLCTSLRQAQDIARRDYAEFKNKFYADGKFNSGLGRKWSQKVFQRVNTRDLIKDPATANFDWVKETTGAGEAYNLRYPGDDNIDYYIYKDNKKYRCLKIENMILYRYRYDTVNHPFVESLGAPVSLARAQKICRDDIAQELLSRKSDLRKFIEKARLALNQQSRSRDY